MTKVYHELHPGQITVLKNPTEENVVGFLQNIVGIPNPNPKNALAGVHKARLSWGEATDEMIEESKKWLAENGYSPTPSPYAVREDSQ